MSAITPSLDQIQLFTQTALQAPLNFEQIAHIKEIFSHFSNPAADAQLETALNEAKYILELKEEQALIALKINDIFLRLKKIQQILPKMESKDYTGLKDDLAQLRSSAELLPKEAFTTDLPKEKVFATISSLDEALAACNPNAWKRDVVARAVIAGAVGVFFALHRQWTQSNGIIARLTIPYFERYGSITYWGAGLGIGVLGMASATAAEKAISTLTDQITSALQKRTADSGKPSEKTESSPQKQEPSIELQILGPALLQPNEVPLKVASMHPAKQLAYAKLTQNQPPAEPLLISKHQLSSPVEALKLKPFEMPKTACLQKDGLFSFPASTKESIHWTAHFSNRRLFQFVKSPLLGQEELLALEHPALYHLKTVLDENPALKKLEGNRIALIQNIYRYGSLAGLDASEFAKATPQKIGQCLTRFEQPTASNLFSIRAPGNPGQAGQPYEKKHLQQLFVRAYTAFTSIRQCSAADTQKIVVHTGNWETGVSGGSSPLAAALCQILAARAAGIELHYYPLKEKEAFLKASALLDKIEKQAPHVRVGDILVHLAKHASEYGIVYDGKSI